MKIMVYEARKDELADLNRLAKELDVELDISEAVPSMETAELAAGCQGVSMLGQGKIDRELLDRFHQMGVGYLSTRTIGHNHIDVAYAKELGIRVCNASYAPNGVADFTIMMILMCLRHYKQALWRGYVNDFSLGGLQGREMKDLTVGVIGTGRIGAQVIRNLSGFGCRILAHDLYHNATVESLVDYVDLDRLLAESDVIFLHCPLFPETQGIINKETIARMKDGVILINNSRGQLVVEQDLADALNSGKVYAAGLDVVSTEPVKPDNPLLGAKNCIITPHISWAAREARQRIMDITVANIQAFMDGKPVNAVNR